MSWAERPEAARAAPAALSATSSARSWAAVAAARRARAEASATSLEVSWAKVAARRESGGSGLGLAIVAAVVEAHGGKVSFDERSDGARFVIELPAGAQAPP